jgi:hypothetical protein
MYKAILFPLFLILPGVVFAQIVTDSQVERLKGRVKTLRWEESSLEGSLGKWQETNRIIVRTRTWDQSGIQIEEVLFGTSPFTRKSDPLIKILATYDEKQKLRTEKSYDVHKPDPANKLVFVPLDAEGKPMKTPPPPPPKPKTSDGAVISQIKYNFDAKGNRFEMLNYDGMAKKGKLSFKHRYIWDKQEKLKEEFWYSSSGKLSEKYIYNYDEQGNESEQIRQNDKGQVVSREAYSEYKFDNQGNWIQRVNRMEYVAAYGQWIKTSVMTYRHITYWQ